MFDLVSFLLKQILNFYSVVNRLFLKFRLYIRLILKNILIPLFFFCSVNIYLFKVLKHYYKIRAEIILLFGFSK